MTRVLIVSYVFPPTGGAGVARSIKLAKYLPDFGVSPAVLTVANPSVPVVDESLMAELSPDLEVTRVRTFEPGYAMKKAAWTDGAAADVGASCSKPCALKRLRQAAVRAAKSALIPDAQVLWQPAAQLAMAKRLVQRKDDVVWITGPPYSPFMLAPLVSARGVGVVLDYRDEWSTLRSAYEMRAPKSAAIIERLERRLLRCADAVTTVTPAFRDNLLRDHSFLDPSSVHLIENGFDPSDFPAELPEPPTDKFVITYAGTVFSLTRPSGFLDALRLLFRDSPALAAHLKVRFIGRVVPTEEASFSDAESIGIERHGYMAKKEVTALLAASHLNLCTLSGDDEATRIYPGKIFELMAIGRPVLTLAPVGALTALVEKHSVGVCLRPQATTEIAADLERRVLDFLAGNYKTTNDAKHIEKFHRRELAGRMAEVLHQLARSKR